MQLSDISLQVTPEGADRALLIGASRMGKSTAAGVLIDAFYDDYVAPRAHGRYTQPKPRGRILISDTKPRWRPEMLANGQRAGRRYRDFLPGTIIPHSRLVSNTSEWDLAWETGEGVCILQNTNLPHDENVRWQVSMMQKFFKTQKHSMPSLLVIDEGMDFFGPTGNGKYGDIVQRSVRAGGEKGLASLILVQRPKTINIQVVTEGNYLMLFKIRYREDLKRLWEMGIPRDFVDPKEPHHFALWRNDHVITHDACFRMPPKQLGRVAGGR